MSDLSLQSVLKMNVGSTEFKFASRIADNDNSFGTMIGTTLPVHLDASRQTSEMGAAFFQPSNNLLGWQGKIKRALDIVLSASALIALMPLFILVAVAIKLESPGAVLFVQDREGKGGKLFSALKFRSMRHDDCDVSGVRQTVIGDSRITKIGAFLRRTSIDELPQLFNVLRGEMSLVGPRPHVRGMMAGGQDYRSLVPHYDLRLLVAPGLTGWAQANGLRGPTTNAQLARQRIEHDLSYIQNFSLWLDIRIIYLTLKREFVGGSGH